MLVKDPAERSASAKIVATQLDDFLRYGTSYHGVKEPALVGRHEQLTRLRAAWKKVGDRNQFLCLTAPAGVGKSRLIAEFAAEVKLAGGSVFEGAGGSSAPWQSILPIAQAAVERSRWDGRFRARDC